MTTARSVTVICDREGDIYRLYCEAKNQNINVLVRARHDRTLMNGESLFTTMEHARTLGTYTLNIRETASRKGRQAILAIRAKDIHLSCSVGINNKGCSDDISLTCIEVEELEDSVPEGEKKIHWRLLTSHLVKNKSDALIIVGYYKHRWLIEQFFRTLKKQGFDFERNQITSIEAAQKLVVMAVCSAVKVMLLVQGRDEKNKQKAELVFTKEEIFFMSLLLKKLEGNTEKQKNLHTQGNLNWATWIMGRLGGWMGYKSERPPGPITIYRGMNIFYEKFSGYELAKDMCIP